VLIDAGLHPERTGWDAFPRVQALAGSNVDSFIITHAHTDHLGGVPYLLQEFPDAHVLATEETIEISKIMLANSAGLMPRQHPTEVLDKLPNYTLEALPKVIEKFNSVKLGSTSVLRNGTPETTLKATFHRSGHILGAAGVLMEFNGRRIFHTGDTSLHEQNLVSSAELPEGPIDVLVSESTNGLTDAYITHDREIELKRLLLTLTQTLEGGGSVMIPVFALGKMQEVISMLWDAMRAGKLPTVDIYTGGMGRRIAEIYDNFKTSNSRTSWEGNILDIPQKELPRRDGLFSGKYFRDPSIVLASSGMMQEGTASYFLAQRWLRERNFAICFVGYTDPRTPGYVVSHAKKGDRVRFGSMKRDVPVRCNIERFRFSAHARREELLEIVDRLRPKHVVLTHGDEQAMAAFGSSITEKFPEISVSAPEVGKWYKLLD
ncbi:MAG TPA: MBL fold metallo-hydrolase, partial [Candidatus Kapabacteria bacterium]|nr:MBL fold metallo-hydrolase [Candidatus Kapabacteria bacterium]